MAGALVGTAATPLLTGGRRLLGLPAALLFGWAAPQAATAQTHYLHVLLHGGDRSQAIATAGWAFRFEDPDAWRWHTTLLFLAAPVVAAAASRLARPSPTLAAGLAGALPVVLLAAGARLGLEEAPRSVAPLVGLTAVGALVMSAVLVPLQRRLDRFVPLDR